MFFNWIISMEAGNYWSKQTKLYLNFQLAIHWLRFNWSLLSTTSRMLLFPSKAGHTLIKIGLCLLNRSQSIDQFSLKKHAVKHLFLASGCSQWAVSIVVRIQCPSGVNSSIHLSIFCSTYACARDCSTLRITIDVILITPVILTYSHREMYNDSWSC